MTTSPQVHGEDKALVHQGDEIAWLLWYARQYNLPVWIGMCSCTAAQVSQSIIVGGKPVATCRYCGKTIELSETPDLYAVQVGDECLIGTS